MSSKTFKVKGTFSKFGETQPFSKEIEAVNEDRALDKIYSLFGSNHKVKRTQIKIEKIEETKNE